MNTKNVAELTRSRMGKPHLDRRSILIIDDEADFASSMQDLLDSEGCHTETAAGPGDIAGVRVGFDAEVILLDIQLKQSSGIELMNELQARWPYARVIIMTGYASKETAIQALKNGAVGYLEKPINPDELRATIRHALWAYDAEFTMLTTQEQLQASLRKAEAANRSKAVFLANMSHELRTPLNAIIGFSEIMKNEHLGPLAKHPYMEYVQSIYKSGLHLLAIVNDVLDLSQIELDSKALEVESVALGEVVEDSCSMVREAAGSRNIGLQQVVPDEPACLRADRRMVRQMLINLVGNAVKFTEDGGQVTVRATCTEGGELHVAVEDNGIGIAADKIDEVFEPFAIAEPIESRGHGGVGLGLSITKQLVEHHGGRLELKSEKGVGTTATLVFPAACLGVEASGPESGQVLERDSR